MAYFLLCKNKQISEDLSQALLKSVSDSTLCSYKRHWKGFADWVMGREHLSHLSRNLVNEFLFSSFNSGLSASTLNLMRSSINFFTLNLINFEDDIICKRLFKFSYKQRPLRPRCTSYWPVSKVLNFLKSWYPIESLSLMQLPLKTLALIALSSSDRGQNLHLTSCKSMAISEDKVEFILYIIGLRLCVCMFESLRLSNG